MDVSMGSPASPVTRSGPREFDRAEGTRESAFDMFFVETEAAASADSAPVEEPATESSEPSANVDESSDSGEDANANVGVDGSAEENGGETTNENTNESADADEHAADGGGETDDETPAPDVAAAAADADASAQGVAVVAPVAVPQSPTSNEGGRSPDQGSAAPMSMSPATALPADSTRLPDTPVATTALGVNAASDAVRAGETVLPAAHAAASPSLPAAPPVPPVEGVATPAPVAELGAAIPIAPTGAASSTEPAVPVSMPTMANATVQDVIEAPTRMARLSTDVPEVIVRSLRSGANEARLTVFPPDLGSIRLRLVEQEGGVRVHAEVQSSLVRDALVNAQNQLHAQLRASGFEMLDFFVDVDAGGSDVWSDPSAEGDAPANRSDGGAAAQGGDSGAGTVPSPSTRLTPGRIDVTA